jgi:hypothetical protein
MLRRRSALILMLEPFVLAVLAGAAVFYFFSTLAQHAKGRGGRPLNPARALQFCALPCLAAVILAPWLGPAALAGYFCISLVAIMRLK